MTAVILAMEEPDQRDPAGPGTTQAEAEKRSLSPKPTSEATSDGKASSAATAAEVKPESPPARTWPPSTPASPSCQTWAGCGDNRRDVPLTCQVVGCGESLSGHAEYYRRYRVCKRHLKGSALIVDGVPQRFCQQCGRFHLLEAFDGEKRCAGARRSVLGWEGVGLKGFGVSSFNEVDIRSGQGLRRGESRRVAK
ncbi:hypothetical protein QBZ16_003826 [Prototheca wickerhamii]|uniref:SBP-type domain-containing protein n=1 Tax=Prototheca wickerhamii TaxID=3111 RepID=A0AAD9MLD7_PROWI|nr:hypothetical protein QBZ16_003826 [Prototheca wickerhamii]